MSYSELLNLQEFEVTPDLAQQRLDLALVALFSKITELAPSRSQIAKWIDLGHVSLNEEIILKASYLVDVGDTLLVEIPGPGELKVSADPSIVLDVVFEDSDLIVINKQAGLVVHPGAGNSSGTLVNALVARLGDDFASDSLRPGIVHRLDKDTSGLMVVAKNQLAMQNLTSQFLPPRKIKREYFAITSFTLSGSEGIIDAPISRHLNDRKKMAVVENGKPAITNWQSVENYSCGASLLRLKLETGRTHQIRVHLQFKKAPIIGDPVYGTSVGSLPIKIRKICQDFPRPALHAARLEFEHPRTAKLLTYQAEMPDDMKQLIEKLKRI